MKSVSIYRPFFLGLALLMCACSTATKGEGTQDIPVAGTDSVPVESTADGSAATSSNASSPSSLEAPPQEANVSPSADGGNVIVYKTRRGDSLMKIAYENLGSLYRWKEIYNANKSKIPNPSRLPVEIELTIVKSSSDVVNINGNGEKHLIKKGETLGTISITVYGTTKRWKELWENNKQLIHNPNQIFAGFFLYYIPDANAPIANGQSNIQGNESGETEGIHDQKSSASSSGIPSPEALSGLVAPSASPKNQAEAAAVDGTPDAGNVDAGNTSGTDLPPPAPAGSNPESPPPNPQ